MYHDLLEKALTVIEAGELMRLESIIEKGRQTFIEVGAALMKIRDSRLYRRDGTFESYCRKRWGFNSSRARQLISAAEVNENIKSVTIVTPATESQTRPLTHLPPDQQREVWQKAVETAPEGKVTARHVEKVAAGIADKITRDGKEQEDSDELFQLKKWYKRAKKRDRIEFARWMRYFDTKLELQKQQSYQNREKKGQSRPKGGKP